MISTLTLTFCFLFVLVRQNTDCHSEWWHYRLTKEKEVEEQPKCVYNPCQNGGTCTAYHDRFRCTCKKGWIGENCERRSICHPNPCVHGHCSASAQGFTCTCQTGYKGELCDLIHRCHPNPCWNGGTCTESSSNVYCDCQTGFRGRFCEYESKCQPINPCINGGECREEQNSYLCMCSAPYRGTNCESLRPPVPRTLERPPATYVVEGPQAIPSPEYGTREVSLYPSLTKDVSRKDNNKNDIALARSIFKPTIFDPSPFGGEVKDPDLNSLHKVTAPLTPEIVREIKAEQDKEREEKENAERSKTESFNEQSAVLSDKNSSSENQAMESDKSSRNQVVASEKSSSSGNQETIVDIVANKKSIRQPHQGVGVSSLTLISQPEAHTNGTKRSLLHVKRTRTHPRKDVAKPKQNSLNNMFLSNNNTLLTQGNQMLNISAGNKSINEGNGSQSNDAKNNITYTNKEIKQSNAQESDELNKNISSSYFKKKKVEDAISAGNKSINEGNGSQSNKSENNITYTNKEIKQSNAQELDELNKNLSSSYYKKKKAEDARASVRSAVSLLRMRGNIVTFRKKLLLKGSKNVSQVASQKSDRNNNIIKNKEKVPIRFFNGTGVSFLRTRGNVVHGKWNKSFLNNIKQVYKKKAKHDDEKQKSKSENIETSYSTRAAPSANSNPTNTDSKDTPNTNSSSLMKNYKTLHYNVTVHNGSLAAPSNVHHVKEPFPNNFWPYVNPMIGRVHPLLPPIPNKAQPLVTSILNGIKPIVPLSSNDAQSTVSSSSNDGHYFYSPTLNEIEPLVSPILNKPQFPVPLISNEGKSLNPYTLGRVEALVSSIHSNHTSIDSKDKPNTNSSSLMKNYKTLHYNVTVHNGSLATLSNAHHVKEPFLNHFWPYVNPMMGEVHPLLPPIPNKAQPLVTSILNGIKPIVPLSSNDAPLISPIASGLQPLAPLLPNVAPLSVSTNANVEAPVVAPISNDVLPSVSHISTDAPNVPHLEYTSQTATTTVAPGNDANKIVHQIQQFDYNRQSTENVNRLSPTLKISHNLDYKTMYESGDRRFIYPPHKAPRPPNREKSNLKMQEQDDFFPPAQTLRRRILLEKHKALLQKIASGEQLASQHRLAVAAKTPVETPIISMETPFSPAEKSIVIPAKQHVPVGRQLVSSLRSIPQKQSIPVQYWAVPQKQYIPQKQFLPVGQRRQQPLMSSSLLNYQYTFQKAIIPRNNTRGTRTSNLSNKGKECPDICRSFCDPWCESIGCCVATNEQLKAIKALEHKLQYPKTSVLGGDECKNVHCHFYTTCVKGRCVCKKGAVGGRNCAPPLINLPVNAKKSHILNKLNDM